MYLFFDTETTGLPKNWKAPVTDLENWPRLVQLAWIESDADGKALGTHDYIVKPENFDIPQASSDIHGITHEKALAEGLPLEEVLNHFLSALGRSSSLVAHNMSFDEKIMGAEFLRQGTADPLEQMKKFCTKTLSTNFCQLKGYYGYKWPTLQELHTKLFGTTFEAAHDASVDIAACKKCFFELRKLGVILV